LVKFAPAAFLHDGCCRPVAPPPSSGRERGPPPATGRCRRAATALRPSGGAMRRRSQAPRRAMTTVQSARPRA